MAPAPRDGDGIPIPIPIPGVGIVIAGTCAKLVGITPGDGIDMVGGPPPPPPPGIGIDIGIGVEERLGANVTGGGGTDNVLGVLGVGSPAPRKGVEPGGAGLRMGVMLMPWGITGVCPCGGGAVGITGSGLGMRMCGDDGITGGTWESVSKPPEGAGGAGCGSGMDILPGMNGRANVLAAAESELPGNWSRGLRLKSPRRCLRGRTLPYVVGWDCGCGA